VKVPGLDDISFAPLVVTGLYLKLVCEMDITIKSRDEPGSVVHGGDLDNRLKVLLDALRVPGKNEKAAYYKPPGEPHCFCLLEDDKLITRLQVRSVRQLRPLRKTEKENDVEVTIAATVKASDKSLWSHKG
jgi:hypothetical protein